MKYLILLLCFSLGSCVFGLKHQPIDFTRPVVITKVEGNYTDYSSTTSKCCRCLYHATPVSKVQDIIPNQDELEGWVVDLCDKYRVGDTITLIKSIK